MSRFFFQNVWRSGTVVASNAHPLFPASHTQGRLRSQRWRSRSGAGSGWGTFLIEANVNDRIDFEETIGVDLEADLTPGIYDASSIASHIEAQLEAAGASDYTVVYNELTNKFRIESDGGGGGGIFSLLWATGANTARSVGSSIGFETSADDTGALSYTADYIAIHTEETLTQDLGSAQDVRGVMIDGHNLQSTAILRAIFSDDDFATIAYFEGFVVDPENPILVLQWDTALSHRYVGLEISDPTNPDGFIEIGATFFGDGFFPKRGIAPGKTRKPSDPSIIKYAENGAISTIQRSHFRNRGYLFKGTAEIDDFEELFDEVGFSKDFYFTERENSVSNIRETTYHVIMTNYDPQQNSIDIYDVLIELETIRE